MIHRLNSLQNLYFEFNQIKVLQPDMFKSLNSIQRVKVQSTTLRHMVTHALSATHLQHISLEHSVAHFTQVVPVTF